MYKDLYIEEAEKVIKRTEVIKSSTHDKNSSGIAFNT